MKIHPQAAKGRLVVGRALILLRLGNLNGQRFPGYTNLSVPTPPPLRADLWWVWVWAVGLLGVVMLIWLTT